VFYQICEKDKRVKILEMATIDKAHKLYRYFQGSRITRQYGFSPVFLLFYIWERLPGFLFSIRHREVRMCEQPFFSGSS